MAIKDACLVKEKTCYFVAVLLGFHPATSLEEQKRGGDRYEIEDQTGEHRLVARKSVLFGIDKEFAKATVGHLCVSVADDPDWAAQGGSREAHDARRC